MEFMHGAAMKPNFLDCAGLDFDNAYRIRRAYSEGDIKTLGNGNTSLIHSPLERPLMINNGAAEDRWEKLSRYRNGKTESKMEH